MGSTEPAQILERLFLGNVKMAQDKDQYLMDQISRGAGAGFPMDKIDAALQRSRDDPKYGRCFFIWLREIRA